MNAEKLLDEMVDAVARVIAVHPAPYIVDKSPIKKALAPYVLEFCETGVKHLGDPEIPGENAPQLWMCNVCGVEEVPLGFHGQDLFSRCYCARRLPTTPFLEIREASVRPIPTEDDGGYDEMVL